MANSPPSQTEKEYGRRLYVSDLNYQGQIRKPTDKEFDDMYKLPHSENKKPYLEDSYEEMEYFLSPPFGFPWDWPSFDLPSTPPSGPWYPPWLLIFTCQVQSGACFCEGEERCHSLRCSHDIVGIEVNDFLTTHPGHFKIDASSGQICITASTGADPVVYFDVTMVGYPGDGSVVYGTHEGLSVTSCSEDDCGCADLVDFSYDDASSGDTVSQSGSTNVFVTGGTSPYTWTIEGTGLTLTDAQTAGLQNTVQAGASACGPGHITITDACNQEAHGFIRVVEDSEWSGWGGVDEVEWRPCTDQWGANSGNVVCDEPIWRYYSVRGGQLYLGGACPNSCRCQNYLITASTGPPDTTLWDQGVAGHGCDHNCTWQSGSRALGYCNIKVQEWQCTP